MNEWLALSSITRASVTAGSICKLYGIPVEWIASFPRFSPTTQRLIGEIVLNESRNWLEFPIAYTGREFSENSKMLNGVKYWDQGIKGTMYWQTPVQHVGLDNLMNHRWVFILKEGGTGIRYVVGAPRVGAELAVDYSNKAGTVTQMSISFRSIHRAPIYEGAVGIDTSVLIDSVGSYIVDSLGEFISTVSTGTDTMVDFIYSDCSSPDFS